MITRKKIILLILFFLVATVAIGYYFYNKGPRDINAGNAIRVTAVELYQAYTTDAAIAQKKYSGKVLLVTGLIERVDKNQQNEHILLLKTNEQNAYINCSLEKPVPGLGVKAEVRLKGLCSGIGQGDADLGLKPDVYLVRCLVE